MLDTDFSGDAAASPNRSLIVNAHILIVEDEALIRSSLKRLLERNQQTLVALLSMS